MEQIQKRKRSNIGVKEENISTILSYIRKHTSVSRIEISRALDMSAATVGRNMDDILGWGLLEYIGTGESNGGRKPDCYNINEKAGYALGLDISKRGIEAGLFNLIGGNEYRQSAKFTKDGDFFVQLNCFINELLCQYSDKNILGIGVGMSGNIVDEVVKHSNVFNYKDVPLGNILRSHFAYPIVVEERVKCAAYAWKTYSSISDTASDTSNVLFMQIGMGIGMGILLNGEIYSGDGSNSAGEIGHIILDENGPFCHCGSRGCLEQLSSETAIVRDVAAGIESGRTSLVCDLLENNMEKLDGNTIVFAAEQGDKLCVEVIQRACKYLAMGINNLFILFNPGKLIIKNNISKNSELISSLIYDNLSKFSLRVFNWPDKVIFEDDEDIVLRGSAQIIIDKVFDNPKIYFS